MRSAAKPAAAAVLALLLCCAAALFFWFQSACCLSWGHYLRGSSGAHILLRESGTPIVLNDRSRDSHLFDGLSDGDRVLVLHDAVLESYPARSAAYFCLRLGAGTRSDLPGPTLEELTQLGWLSAPA